MKTHFEQWILEVEALQLDLRRLPYMCWQLQPNFSYTQIVPLYHGIWWVPLWAKTLAILLVETWVTLSINLNRFEIIVNFLWASWAMCFHWFLTRNYLAQGSDLMGFYTLMSFVLFCSNAYITNFLSHLKIVRMCCCSHWPCQTTRIFCLSCHCTGSNARMSWLVGGLVICLHYKTHVYVLILDIICRRCKFVTLH